MDNALVRNLDANFDYRNGLIYIKDNPNFYKSDFPMVLTNGTYIVKPYIKFENLQVRSGIT